MSNSIYCNGCGINLTGDSSAMFMGSGIPVCSIDCSKKVARLLTGLQKPRPEVLDNLDVRRVLAEGINRLNDGDTNDREAADKVVSLLESFGLVVSLPNEVTEWQRF